jgi:hypothetical protein
MSGQLHTPAFLDPGGEEPSGAHWIGGWVKPRDGLDAAEKRKISSALGIRTPIPVSSRFFSFFLLFGL